MSASLRRNGAPNARFLVGQLVLLGGAFVFAFHSVMCDLVKAWASSDDYSHGFFIAPVAVYIVWQKRWRLASLPVEPSASGGWCLTILLACSVMARYAEIATLSALTMILALASLILFVAGWAYLKEMLFPLFLLFFMIPIPEQVYSSLTVPLQLLVSRMSVAIAHVLEIPIYGEGNVLHLPNRTLEVVQACSGLRSLMSLSVIGLITGYFFLRGSILRFAMLASALPLAILVNCLRVLMTIIVLYYFHFNLTDGLLHTFFGAATFAVALVLLFLTQKGLARWDH